MSLPQTNPVSSPVSTALNITTATVIKTAPGVLVSCSVLVNGSSEGGIYDCTTVAAASIANQLIGIPTNIGIPIDLTNWSCKNGIVVIPGTGQTVAIAYE